MTTLTQGSHPQLEARQLIQQAAAVVASYFPAFRDQFLTHCPVIQVRTANREKHKSTTTARGGGLE
jgi:hypothetical protein